MPRTLSQAALEASRDPHLEDVIYQLLIISHEDLDEPVRVVNDSQDLEWTDPTTSRTETYKGWPFELELPDEGDRTPRGRLTIQNVDRRIGEGVRRLHQPPRIRIVVFSEADPTDIWLDYNHLWFTQITGNVRTVSGTVGAQQQTSHPWPKDRASERDYPALFR